MAAVTARPPHPVDLLDELERRRRRDYVEAREWLIRVCEGQDGSISVGASGGGEDGRMVPLLLDYEDVADALQVSVPTVKRLVSAGQLPAVRVASARRVRRADLEAYVHGLGRDRPGPDETRRVR